MSTRPTSTPTPEQLTLLSGSTSAAMSASELPLQFRLDQRTRQRGLAHIAAIRRQLDQRPAVAGVNRRSAPATARPASATARDRAA